MSATHHGMMSRSAEPDDHGQDVEPVGDRVEDLAELGGLVEPAGEIAVEPVGEPESISTPSAQPSASGPSTSQRKTGTPASRAMLSRLGTVHTRLLRVGMSATCACILGVVPFSATVRAGPSEPRD